jgi:hypothetical protein
MAHQRLTLASALALTLFAFTVPTADARPDQPLRDLRVSSSLAGTPTSDDLRSPDARDAARPAESRLDRRSPDARDAAHVAAATRGPSAAAATHAATPAATTSGDADWGNVAIVGGGAAVVLLLGLGAVFGVRRRDAARKARALVVSR